MKLMKNSCPAGSVVQYSPMSSVFPSLPSPKVKQEDEGFSYDHMPDNMFNDDTL